ncbi:MAG: hypothetical protein J0H98_07260 [Solirubrobacterales bacterium]|nr:hypothetical protein [Solirubrobacterales bacterium]
MTGQTDTRPVDYNILASSVFDDAAFQAAALAVVNRIREQLGLQHADRLLAGYRNDEKWGNPVVFTITAGCPLLVARYEKPDRRILVDSINSEHEFRLIKGSVVERFVHLFNDGRYPELEA